MTRTACTLAAALLLAACGSSETPDTSEDTSADTTTDVSGDVEADVEADVVPDIGEDAVADVGEDTMVDVGEDVAVDIGVDTMEVGADTAADVPTEVAIDAACVDGETTSIEFVCADGRFGNVACTCEGGEFACGPDPCLGTACETDMECAAGELCRVCHPELPMPCDPGCYDTGCGTAPDSEVVCAMPRLPCDDGLVAVIRSGCWECVEVATCNDIPLACADVGGFCTAGPAGCPDGTRVSDTAVCASLSDCCEPDTSSDCERAGASCVDSDICPDGTTQIRSSCAPTGGICCAGTLPPIRVCDDGSFLECDMIEPTCDPSSVAAVRGGCWECVNPATCLAWGLPGCDADADCGFGEYCYDCATSSCPFCEDCVAACVRGT